MRATTAENRTLTVGEKVYSTLHRNWVRVEKVEDVWVVVRDANTGKLMPDLVHVTQIKANPAA